MEHFDAGEGLGGGAVEGVVVREAHEAAAEEGPRDLTGCRPVIVGRPIIGGRGR